MRANEVVFKALGLTFTGLTEKIQKAGFSLQELYFLSTATSPVNFLTSAVTRLGTALGGAEVKAKMLAPSVTVASLELLQQQAAATKVAGEMQRYRAELDKVMKASKSAAIEFAGPINPLTQLADAIRDSPGDSFAKTIQDVAAAISEIGTKSIFASQTFREWETATLATEQANRQLSDAINELPVKGRNTPPFIIELMAKLRELGIVLDSDLATAALRARIAFEEMGRAGVFSAEDMARAQIKYLEAVVATGQASQEQIRVLEALKRVMGGVGESAVRTVQVHNKALEGLKSQVSTIFTDMSRGIANVIIKGESLGKVFQTVGQEIGTAIVRFAIEGGTKLLLGQLDGILSKVPLIGKALGDLFGQGGGGVLGTTVGASGGAAATIGNPSGAAGSVGGPAGSAAGGLSGALSAGAGIVSAVSGIIGNFQFAHMNTALGRIEESTRYTQLFLGGRADQGILGQLFKLNEELAFGSTAKLTAFDIAPTLRNIRDVLRGGITATTGGGGVTINGPVTIEIKAASDPRATAEAVMDTLRGLSPKFQPA